MKTLQDILYKVGIQRVQGNLQLSISGIFTDSRQVIPGSIFIAIAGSRQDGHDFVEPAIENGAVAILCQRWPSTIHASVTYVQVEDVAQAAGWMSHHYYDEPSCQLKLIGVTGTNGKTTIVTLLYKLFSALGYRCGMLSTVHNLIGEEVLPSTHTTPDPITLNALLRRMVDAGCTHAFMETSSHAIHQHRIAGLQYTGGIFSNITHDHLDYHGTFDEYIRVKKSFFDSLPPQAFAISNADDRRGSVMLQNTAAKKYYYSLHTLAEFKGKILENDLTGLVMTINEQEVHFRMIGEFNAYNILAVYGTACCLGEEKAEVLRCLSVLTGAEGRFDYLISPKENILGIVDYAHTPDALVNVLATIQKLKKEAQQVITVVGCGGDRDRTKRPVMGEVACKYSDRVVFTSDNPRSEDPAQIIRDMESGLGTAARRKYLSVPDRREAIRTALHLAHPADILLIAGKGHEKYQEIQGKKYPFDDKSILKECFALMDK